MDDDDDDIVVVVVVVVGWKMWCLSDWLVGYVVMRVRPIMILYVLCTGVLVVVVIFALVRALVLVCGRIFCFVDKLHELVEL